MFSPGQAYWNQRLVLAREREPLVALLQAVANHGDFMPIQGGQLLATALEFKPDLILELGRGQGNSTCVFTQAANLLKPQPCQVCSLCLANAWRRKAVPNVRRLVTESWFEPLKAFQADILRFPFEARLRGFDRILVFWDAHGFEVAECVLGEIMPLIAERPHFVVMHDLSDARYCGSKPSYRQTGLWKGGNDADAARVRLGHIDTGVEQAIAALDFTSRNNVGLYSVDHDLHEVIGNDEQKVAEMRRLLGDEFFSLVGHWFYFSLNERPGPYSFPRFSKPRPEAPVLARIKDAWRILRHGHRT